MPGEVQAGCGLDGGLKMGYPAQDKKVTGIWMGAEKVLEGQKAGRNSQSGGPRRKFPREETASG